MRRTACLIALAFLAASTLRAQAPQPGGAVGNSLPAAVEFQSECTGFIANPDIRRELFVAGGADDDFHTVVRQFVQGDSIFISRHNSGDIAVGAEYRVVRPANDLFRTMHYQGERGMIRSVGKPYEDVARVQVTHLDPEGAVAKVLLSCGPIMPGDTLVPFESRLVPQYTVTKPLDPFAPLNLNNARGRITASENNYGYVGGEMVVYIDLGDGGVIRTGDRFRIYKRLPPHSTGFMKSQRLPPETVGEAVVLSVQRKSCVAIVVSSSREISTGDYVELE